MSELFRVTGWRWLSLDMAASDLRFYRLHALVNVECLPTSCGPNADQTSVIDWLNPLVDRGDTIPHANKHAKQEGH